MSIAQPLGPSLVPGGVHFLLWAPEAKRVELCLGAERSPMHPLEDGYFGLDLQGAGPGMRYAFSLDGGPARADPASRLQPEGPHGQSEIVGARFPWTDGAWRGLPLHDHVIYELHVGTYTPDGTFEAVIPHLEHLRDLGITAVELMPIAQFPGERNWGYDGVLPFAAQNSYGGPQGLKRLVDACHARGLAVILDVVYNHLGPEGNYLGEFGPYFTERYKTPWGPALNFGGEHSDHVRRYFTENALYWTVDCHIDALRLDAVHAIVDSSAVPFIEELGVAVHQRAAELGRRIHLIAESAANDVRLIRPSEQGGLGMDAQWSDDFHHALRTLLTDDRSGYYGGYGELAQLAKAFSEGFVYTGERSPVHKRRHGSSTRGIPAERFVVFGQNHDHVGNRMLGERLSALVPAEKVRLAAAAVLLSPYVPLLFMGEEYAEAAPFLYFVSHTDPGLVEAVRKGRAEEFASFGWEGEPPDPQSAETFERSRLRHDLRGRRGHREMLAWYAALLKIRRETPALASLSRERLDVRHDELALTLSVQRWTSDDRRSGTEALLAFNFSQAPAPIPLPHAPWRLLLHSGEARFGGGATEAEMKLMSGPAPLLPGLTFALYITPGA